MFLAFKFLQRLLKIFTSIVDLFLKRFVLDVLDHFPWFWSISRRFASRCWATAIPTWWFWLVHSKYLSSLPRHGSPTLSWKVACAARNARNGFGPRRKARIFISPKIWYLFPWTIEPARVLECAPRRLQRTRLLKTLYRHLTIVLAKIHDTSTVVLRNLFYPKKRLNVTITTSYE